MAASDASGLGPEGVRVDCAASWEAAARADAGAGPPPAPAGSVAPQQVGRGHLDDAACKPWAAADAGAEDAGVAAASEAAQAAEAACQRAARNVSYLSLGASLVAAVAGLGVGIADAELALVGFGMEASLDALSSALVIWRFKKPKMRHHEDQEAAMRFKAARDLRRERNSSVGIGVTFVFSSVVLMFSALVKFVTFDAKDAHRVAEERDGANWSLILSLPSAVVFGLLAHRKFALSKALGSQVLRQDALCSVLGASLAAIVAAAGFFEEVSGNVESMAIVDSVASIIIGLILLVEGLRTLRHNLGAGWQQEHHEMA